VNKVYTLKDLVINTINDQKGSDVITIDMENKSDIADYIIIASGTSSRHILTIKEKIVESVKLNNFKKLSTQGEEGLNWIVIDLEDIIVHLFRPEVRDYYKIEKIWLK
jgi:ribosome-associated protein